MARGLAIVSTSGTGVGEALTDGESALLAPQWDVEGFAGGLERLIVDAALRERLASRARERVAEQFDRSANLPQVLEALASAALIPTVRSPRRRKAGTALEAVA